jgi:hypothetical protein
MQANAMHHHGDFFGITVSAALVSSPWWLWWFIQAIEEYSWIAGKFILPTLGIVLAIAQIWYVIRKHQHLGGDKK